MAINEITSEKRDEIRRQSAEILPNRPSAAGWDADNIRKAFYLPILTLIEQINAIVAQANQSDTDLDETLRSAITNAVEDSYKKCIEELVAKTLKINGHALDSNITLSKSDIGLENVDNTADLDKPVSNAQKKAIEDLYTKCIEELVAKTLTVNGHALDSNVTLSKKDIGLENVDNTSDLDKPVSNAQKNAFGCLLGLDIDSDYIMTLQLKNASGDVLDKKTIDFPLESVVVKLTYADGIITFHLQNGTTCDVELSDLERGLISDSELQEKVYSCIPIKCLTGTSENPIILHELDDGYYVIDGRFKYNAAQDFPNNLRCKWFVTIEKPMDGITDAYIHASSGYYAKYEISDDEYTNVTFNFIELYKDVETLKDQMGDVDAAFDELHTYAQNLVNGGEVS